MRTGRRENRADGQNKICHGDDRHVSSSSYDMHVSLSFTDRHVFSSSYVNDRGQKPRCTRGRSLADEAESDDGGSDFQGLGHRDPCGNMWGNSEVFTSVRVHVVDGEAIAPIYDEYLRHLRAKGFVESWSWCVNI